jgi:transposase
MPFTLSYLDEVSGIVRLVTITSGEFRFSQGEFSLFAHCHSEKVDWCWILPVEKLKALSDKFCISTISIDTDTTKTETINIETNTETTNEIEKSSPELIQKAWDMHQKGQTITKIAESLDRHYTVVHRWIKKIELGKNIEEFRVHRTQKEMDDLIEEIIQATHNHPNWSVAKIAREVDYERQRTWKILQAIEKDTPEKLSQYWLENKNKRTQRGEYKQLNIDELISLTHQYPNITIREMAKKLGANLGSTGRSIVNLEKEVPLRISSEWMANKPKRIKSYGTKVKITEDEITTIKNTRKEHPDWTIRMITEFLNTNYSRVWTVLNS